MKRFKKDIIFSVILFVFMSIYTTVDGLFIAKCVNTNALAAINISYPIVNVMFALGFGFSMGVSTRISLLLGRKMPERAAESFTICLILECVMSFGLVLISIIFLKPLLSFLGATESTYSYCRIYALIALGVFPIGVTKEILVGVLRTQNLMKQAMLSSVLGGVVNIILDYVFIVPLNMGIFGAGFATAIGITSSFAVNSFLVIKKTDMHLKKWKGKFWEEAVNIEKLSRTNGIMELSYAVILVMFNRITYSFCGDDGIAAYTVIGYIQYALSAIIIGISNGSSNFLSFYKGQENKPEVEKYMKLTLRISFLSGIFLTCIGFSGAGMLTGIFLEKGTKVYDLAFEGIRIISASYLFMGLGIALIGVENSLEQSKRASIDSLLRTIILPVLGALILSKIHGISGVWESYVFAELAAVLIILGQILRNRGIHYAQ